MIRFGTLEKKNEEAEANAESWILFEQIEAQSTKPGIGPVAFPPFVQGPANSTGRKFVNGEDLIPDFRLESLQIQHSTFQQPPKPKPNLHLLLLLSLTQQRVRERERERERNRN